MSLYGAQTFNLGVMYTHWASMDCASEADNHMLIVIGNLLQSAANGIQLSQPLCQTVEVNNTLRAGFEGLRPVQTRRLSEVTCALCLLVGNSVVFTHYGNSDCPPGWNLVYNGLMVIPTGANATAPICATTSGSSQSALSSVSFLTDERGSNLACSVCSL